MKTSFQMTKKDWIISGVLSAKAAILLLLSGCSPTPHVATAANDLIYAHIPTTRLEDGTETDKLTGQVEFPAPALGEEKTIRLSNNKLFMWPNQRPERTDPTTGKLNINSNSGKPYTEAERDSVELKAHASDIARALNIGAKVDELEDMSLPFNKRTTELSSQYESLYNQFMSDPATAEAQTAGSPEQLEVLQRKVTSKTNDIKKYQDKLDVLLAKKPETLTQPDRNNITTYTAKIEKLKGEAQKISDDMKTQAGLFAAKKKEFSEANPVFAEYQATDEQKLSIENQASAQLAPLMDMLGSNWFKDQPSSVTITFEKEPKDYGRISVVIQGWPTPQSRLSTESKTVTDVSYSPKGGVFTFNVQMFADAAQTDLEGTYKFEFARARYDVSAKFGKMFFAGDLTYTDKKCDASTELKPTGKLNADGTPEMASCLTTRKGSAKFGERYELNDQVAKK